MEWLLEVGDDMQTIVGANQDLISFDPRGGPFTPFTSPYLSFLRGRERERYVG